MNSLKYFHINNVKFNYTLEFQSNHLNDYWKHNAPLLEYCETIGVNIPHYCYHKNLSISGNCRMCLVELKNSPKPIVSCAMSAKSCLNNSEIFTNSPLVKKARENVLEFLLLNHPLDCPICDQGGECDLQDQSLFFGISKKRFYNFKRIVTDKNIGPIVKTVMTRCIHCTRCVRFASEIAGTEDLGMFGRGLDSEIGTYINKTFQSELSGNVVDLCPVGALTSKPYPFVSRSWELKNVNSVDFSDGFGSNLLIFLKNNKITKISPGFNTNTNTNNWLSDKSRFAFEGMFSPERSLIGTIKPGNNENELTANNWKLLFSEIILTIYFQDHLSKHFLQHNKMFIIFDYNISLEVLNLLIILKKRYSFIELRKAEGQKLNNDLDSNFTIKSKGNLEQNLNKSDMCFMVGLNSRYEGSTFNNALRKRYLKGNFKLISLSSCKDLTFPETYLGLTNKHLSSIAEGNNRLCQELLTSTNPAIVASSENFLRKDHNGILNTLTSLKKSILKYNSRWNNLNILTNSLNEAGVNYLEFIDSISVKNFNESSGLYFLNSGNSLNVQKILSLKLLNYLNFNNNFPKICINQTAHTNTNAIPQLGPQSHIYNYINLPNNVYFESTGSYITTEGVLKKNIKFIQSTKQTKDDWQIIRKLSSYLNKINFLSTKHERPLNFNNSTFIKYKTYSKFLYYASSHLLKNKTEIGDISEATLIPRSSFRTSKSKLYSTKFKVWINDFYIGGKDPYSKHSTTMINCSKVFRLEKNNFSHIVL